ncbi:MAG: porin family protein [Alkalimonas sp.]|nr:porin family protein [Alkalimonas sp.]
MKKLALLAGATALFAGQAVAHEGYYVGAQYDRHEIKLSAEGESDSFNLGSVGLLAGYQLNENFAIEGRWQTGVQNKSFNEGNESVDFKLNNRFAVLGKGMVPLSNEFSLYGLAGYSHAKYGVSANLNEGSGRGSFTGKGFTWGVGGEFALNEQLAVHLEYNDLPKGKIPGVSVRANAVTVGMNYRF